jgi:hypothetical protein
MYMGTYIAHIQGYANTIIAITWEHIEREKRENQ